MNHTQIGDITEQKFILFCMEHNIPISKPVTNNLPYDCIIDLNGKLLKIQVKTGYYCKSADTFMFNTRSTSKNYNECTNKDYKGKIDGFIVWYNKIPNKFAYIPIEKALVGNMRLCFSNTPKPRQHKFYDYDFENML